MKERPISWWPLAATTTAVAFGCFFCCFCSSSSSSSSRDERDRGTFRLVSLTSTLSEFAGHVIGDLSAEVQMAPLIDVQVQWFTVMSTSDGTSEEEMRSDNQTVNTSYASGHSANTRHRRYTVPIVGDTWCTMEESTWYDLPNQRFSSTLSCRRLAVDSRQPLILFSLRAIQGALQLDLALSPLRTSTEGDRLLKGNVIVPITRHKRVYNHLTPGESLQLNFTAEMPNNETVADIRLCWSGDITSSSSDESCRLRSVALLDHTYLRNNISYTQFRLISAFGTIWHTVIMVLYSANFDNQGTYWVVFSRSADNSNETLKFTTSIIVQSNVPPHQPISIASRPSLPTNLGFHFHIQSCSGATVAETPEKEFRFRFGVADCVYCTAVGWSVTRLHLERDGGTQLGTEESHSVYWYRDSYLRSTIVFVIRSPSDKYDGDYVCYDGSRRTSGGGDCEPSDLRCRHFAKFRIVTE